MSENNGNGQHPKEPSGGKGELLSDPSHLRGDAVLVRRAIREQWPISLETKTLVVSEMDKIIRDEATSPNFKIAAAKVLVAADSVNARREQPENAASGGVNVNIGINLQEIRQELLKDADRLRVSGLNSKNGDASPVRTNGKPRPLDSGPSSNGSGQGNNGYDHGG